MADCEKLLLSEFTDDDGETSRLLKEIDELVQTRVNTNPDKTFAQHFNEVVNEIADSQAASAARDELALVKSLQARESLLQDFRNFRDNLGARPFAAVSQAVETAGNSVMSYQARMKASFSLEIEEAGLDRFFARADKDEVIQTNILKEVGELNKKHGNPGVSKSPEALQVAKIYQRSIDSMRARQAELGIRVDDLEGRMLRQTWLPDSLRQFGDENDFANAMLAKVDRRRTFGREASKQETFEFLKQFYRERVSGGLRDVPLTRKGVLQERPTFAKQQLFSREIHLNSAEDVLYALNQFGDGNVAAAMFSSVAQTALKTRTTEVFGVNPRNTLDFIRENAKRGATAEEASRIQNPSVAKSFWHGDPEAMMDIIDGSFDALSSNPNMAMFSHMVGNSVRAGFLQGVLVSSIPDLTTTHRAGARIGASVSSNIKSRWDWAFQDTSPGLARRMAGAVESANAYNIGALTQRVAPTSLLAKSTNISTVASNATMKWGGVNAWTRHNKGTAWVMGASTLSKMVDVPYDDLEKSLKGMLARGRVGKDEWERIRKTEGVVHDADGHTILNSEVLGREDAQRISDALFSFVNDAVPTPGVRERAILTQGTVPGTVEGVLMRAVSSLLGYPISFMTRQMSRELESGGAKGAAGLAHLAGSTLMAGYVAVLAKDFVAGKNRDYLSDDLDIQRGLFLEAAAKGGFGGFAGSLIIDATRFGSPVSGTLGGAPSSFLDQLIDGTLRSAGKVATGDIEKAASTFAKAWRPVIPFASLPYTKAAVDTLIYHPLLEATDPASLKRMEDNWRRRTGGEFFLED